MVLLQPPLGAFWQTKSEYDCTAPHFKSHHSLSMLHSGPHAVPPPLLEPLPLLELPPLLDPLLLELLAPLELPPLLEVLEPPPELVELPPLLLLLLPLPPLELVEPPAPLLPEPPELLLLLAAPLPLPLAPPELLLPPGTTSVPPPQLILAPLTIQATDAIDAPSRMRFMKSSAVCSSKPWEILGRHPALASPRVDSVQTASKGRAEPAFGSQIDRHPRLPSYARNVQQHCIPIP